MPILSTFHRGRFISYNPSAQQSVAAVSGGTLSDPVNVGSSHGILTNEMRYLAKVDKPRVNMGQAAMCPPITHIGTYGTGILGDTHISKLPKPVQKVARNNLVFHMP